MEIKAITINAVSMAPERGVQGNKREETDGKEEKNLFGPAFRVSLSREGKELSRLREEEDYYEKIKTGYLEELSDIDDQINALNTSYEAKKDMSETIERQQEVLRAMRNQKQYQMEESQRRAREAQETAAAQSGKYQEEIDKNNREMRTLLRTIEEAGKAEEQRENGTVEIGSRDDGDAGAENQAGGAIRSSAGQFTASSVRREMDVEKMIAGLDEAGHRYLDMADTITRAVLKENESVRRALGQEDISVEEMEELMGPVRKRIDSGVYAEVENYRGWGLQILQDALDCKLQHMADDPLRGLEETKKSVMLSAEDAAFRHAVQGRLEKASEKLDAEVKELIDKRNKVDGVRPEKEEEREEREIKEEEKLSLPFRYNALD